MKADPPEPAQIAELIETIHELGAQVELLKQQKKATALTMEAVEKARELKDEEIAKRQNRRITAVVVGVVAAIVVGVLSYGVGNKAQKAVDTLNADRRDRSITACHDDNTSKQQVRDAVASNAQVTKKGLEPILSGPSPNPEALKAFVDQYNKAIDEGVVAVQASIGFKRIDGSIAQNRDCTQAGIDAYFAEQKDIVNGVGAPATTPQPGG